MTVEIGADGKPKPKRKGTFTKETAKTARARSGKGKGKQTKGLAVEVRKHKKLIVDGLLELAKSGSATARERALGRLADIGWGRAPSAEAMGAVERVDGAEFDRSPNGDVLWRRANGVIILPATEPDLDFSKLTLEELETFERLRDKVMGKPNEPRLTTEEQLAEGRRQSDEWHKAHPSPAITSEAAPSESAAAVENAAPTQSHDLAAVIPMFPAPPAPAGLDTVTNDRLWPEKEPA